MRRPPAANGAHGASGTPQVPVLRRRDFLDVPGLAMRVMPERTYGPVEPHAHDFDELVVITGGRAVHVVDGQPHRITRGDVFVVKGASVHAYRDTEGMALTQVLYDPARVLRAPRWELGEVPGFAALFRLEPELRRHQGFDAHLRLHERELLQVQALFAQLHGELEQRAPGFAVAAEALLAQVAVFLARCYTASPSPPIRSLQRIAEAVQYLDANLCEPVDIAALAARHGMSTRNFQRLFKRAVGTPALGYVHQRRLEHACQLLARVDTPVSTIAFEVGFADSNYFSRLFRKRFGTSPSAWRSRATQGSGDG